MKYLVGKRKGSNFALAFGDKRCAGKAHFTAPGVSGEDIEKIAIETKQ